ncbi:hypothetical protein J6590_018880 [Homalodisca vitripennis]|nr:hypothetical protein J6590_018880 [Homalodisca vitripennis]
MLQYSKRPPPLSSRSVLETDVKRRDRRLLKVHGSIWPHLCRRAFPTPSRSAANRLHSCCLHCETYKDRVLKKNQWSQLCSIFCYNFEDQTPKEKAATCKDLQSKWRSIRDAYVRSVHAKKTKSGQGCKNIKSYIYAKHLEFFNLSANQNRTESSLAEEDNLNDEERIEEGENSDSESQMQHDTLGRSSSTMYRKRRANFEHKLEKYIGITTKRTASLEDNNSDDMDFF